MRARHAPQLPEQSEGDEPPTRADLLSPPPPRSERTPGCFDFCCYNADSDEPEEAVRLARLVADIQKRVATHTELLRAHKGYRRREADFDMSAAAVRVRLQDTLEEERELMKQVYAAYRPGEAEPGVA